MTSDTAEIRQVISALPSINKSYGPDSNFGCRCQIFAQIIDKYGISSIESELSQQMLVNFYFRFDSFYPTGDNDPVEHIPNHVILLKMRN